MAKRKARRISKPQPEQNTLYYKATGTVHYLDLAASLTAINRKQYHQTKNLKPLAYHVRAQAVTMDSGVTPIKFSTAPNTWTTRNAVTMLGAMYSQQLSKNNIRRSQLPTYGREMRLALNTAAGYTHGAGSDGFAGSATLASNLQPVNNGGTEFFADYTGSDGTTISYETANDLSLFSIPEATADGEPETVVPALIGTTNHDDNDLAVISEYLKSRRNQHDETEVDLDLPSDDSLLIRLGSSADEHLDDVIDAIEETGDQRPYNEAGANTQCLQGALMAAGDYCSFIAPLGLIRFDGHADHDWFITVSAITEM